MTKTDGSSFIIPQGCLPAYLAEAFGDLYGEDGLLVLGQGLGWLQLLASLTRFYVDTHDGHLAVLQESDNDNMEKNQNLSLATTTSACKPPLIFVLRLKEAEPVSYTHLTLPTILRV